MSGEPQLWNAAESIRHLNVDPDSLELKPNVADRLVIVPDGPLSIVVSGAVKSTVNAG
ncbi:MAG: hypothetical protein H0U42_11555 [Thermoleophilaceae bacterium]|nr:hypothetical protein [Thermoleophilaceae bacterium]